MQVDAVLCDAVTVREGLLHILGAGITQILRADYPAPLLADLAMWIEDDVRLPAGPKEYRVHVVIRCENETIGEVRGGAGIHIPVDHQDDILLAAPVWISHLVVPRPGKYIVEIRVDDELARTIWFRAGELQPAVPAAQSS